MKILFKLTEEDARKTGHVRAVEDDLSYVLQRTVICIEEVTESDADVVAKLCEKIPILEGVLDLSRYRVIRWTGGVQIIPIQERT
jgi:hypothetical protein